MEYLLNYKHFEPTQVYCSIDQEFDHCSRDKFGCVWLEPDLVRREADTVETVVAISGVIPLTSLDQVGS